MMRLKDDLLVLLEAAADGQLAHMSARWRDDAALTVVMAAKGYPGTPEKGSVIRGLDEAASDGVEIFHAGTAERDGEIVANGGRVLNVTAIGKDGHARRSASPMKRVDRIDWPEGFCRRDIGWRAVERENGRVGSARRRQRFVGPVDFLQQEDRQVRCARTATPRRSGRDRRAPPPIRSRLDLRRPAAGRSSCRAFSTA